MLLIYVPKLTNRLGYTLNLMFREILHAEFGITTDEEAFERHEGAKLAYNRRRIGDAPFIKPVELLFLTRIVDQEISSGNEDGVPTLFQVYGRDLDFGFDPLAATFYLVSRYEEYLPHREDMHNRFDAHESIAYQLGFLQTPVVDRWALMVRDKLEARYPDYRFPRRTFDFIDTIDIDTAYCYRHKGLFRTFSGGMRDLVTHQPEEVASRVRTLMHRERDPYDTFDYIFELKKRYAIKRQVFFALLSDYSDFDKNISHNNNDFRELLQHLADYAKMGIHTSYYSYEEPAKVELERDRLSDIVHRTVTRNRFHFLRFKLPQSYKVLIRNGIEKDYTMGYAGEPGFRTGTCTPHHFYDLESDSETTLKVYPFAVMDATLCRHLMMTPEEALAAFCRIMDEVKAVEGTFISIWHNESLSDRKEWKGWRPVYEGMLAHASALMYGNDGPAEWEQRTSAKQQTTNDTTT